MESDSLPSWINLAIVIILVILNGFFVAAEFAVVKVRNSRLDSLVTEGNSTAKFARSITNNLNAYLSACQLGITLASLGLGWLGEPAIAKMIKPVLEQIGFSDVAIHTTAFIIAFTIMTFLHITIGEQVPKMYAIRKSEQVTLWTSIPLVIFYKMMFPLIWSLNAASNWMLRLVGIEPTEEDGSAHTEDEIRILMKESHENGFIDNTELTLVDNIFDFSDTNAREIMIPRTEMDCLYAHIPFEENMSLAMQDMRTRYPVCDPDKDNVIGFVHIKDLLKPNSNIKDIRKMTRPITNVPESMPISTLLKLMQKRKTQMALLIDEYGGTSGIVTLEDILEEIVGDIQDEFDRERPSIEVRDEHTYSIDGLLLIEEVNSQFGLNIESEDYDTIGGWVYSKIEIPPKKNQRISYNDNIEFIVDETDNKRISRLTVRVLARRPA